MLGMRCSRLQLQHQASAWRRLPCCFLPCEWATRRLPCYPMHRRLNYILQIPSRVRERCELVSRSVELGSKLIKFFHCDNTILIRFWTRAGIVSRNLFWLSDDQWKRIEPHLPTDVRGVERADDRRVISGIVHVLRSGCRWRDCPPDMVPRQRFITGLCAGPGAVSGKTCSGSLPGMDERRARR